MSHKVHPKIFRVKETNDWLSRGFYGKNFKRLLKEDFVIRAFLDRKLKDLSVERIEINRLPNKTGIVIYTSRPGLIIGRGGEGVERLNKELLKSITKEMHLSQKESLDLEKKLKLEIKEVKNPWVSAKIVAEWISQKIERRTPFRKTIKQAVEKAMANKEVEGAKVEVSGRLDGVQIARKERAEAGRLPRNTIRADIDYVSHIAVCTYGVIGIKVWLYKGEKFDK
ncbi:MAG TPA: 30S ribosomal protein S3 [Candidatus Pacearchaeota archaeon]|nr:30S ribosomal protein S3 [Candidatus Pacearchaeota archaeon]